MAGRTIAMTVARGVVKKAFEHWRITLAAGAGAAVTAVAAYFVGGAMIRRRRETLLERTLRYLDGVEKYRDQIAQSLQNLRTSDDQSESETVATQIAKKTRTVEADLRAADQVLSAFRSQQERLTRRLAR